MPANKPSKTEHFRRRECLIHLKTSVTYQTQIFHKTVFPTFMLPLALKSPVKNTPLKVERTKSPFFPMFHVYQTILKFTILILVIVVLYFYLLLKILKFCAD